MLKRITYRQKLKYLLMGTLVFVFISYQFSISKTIKEYKIYTTYKAGLSNASNEKSSLSLLESKKRMLEGIMNKFFLDTIDQSKNLLRVTGIFCNENNLELKEYKPFPASVVETPRTLTRSVTVKGSFIDCLHLLYYLEMESDVGRIGSVNFKSYNIPGESETFLTCTIFIQNLIPSTNEN